MITPTPFIVAGLVAGALAMWGVYFDTAWHRTVGRDSFWSLPHLCIYGGGCYTFFVEIFTTKTRFTSAAISYNVAYAIFGGTAPFVGTALVAATDVAYSPGFYMSAAAVIVLLLLTLTKVPETRGRMG